MSGSGNMLFPSGMGWFQHHGLKVKEDKYIYKERMKQASQNDAMFRPKPLVSWPGNVWGLEAHSVEGDA